MATKKAVGAVSNGRDSNSRREGVKKFEGEVVTAGAILVRQQGNKFWPGENAYQGHDFTLHAKVAGKVVFAQKRRKTYDGSLRREVYVSVEPVAAK